MSEFKLSVKAKQDLKDISVFTQARWGREHRNIYLKQLDESFHLLAANSSLGKSCDEIIKGYVKFPHGSHDVFYKLVDPMQILVIRYLHERMDYNPTLNG